MWNYEEGDENSEEYNGLGGPTINGAEEENGQQDNNGPQNKSSKDKVKDEAKDEAKKQVKKQVKEQGKKEVAKAATKGTVTAAKGVGGKAAVASVAAPLATVLLWVAIVLIAIIALIGIVCFFVFMPGQVVEKLKDLGQSFLDGFKNMVDGKENRVYYEEIANVANYLEKMGYDLRGEGFVSGDLNAEVLSYDDATSIANSINASIDVEQKVLRNNDTGDVVAINSKPIKTYIVSDNLCYLVKNANFNFRAGIQNNPKGFIISPVFAASSLFGFLGNPDWGSGLISIYHEKDNVLGVKGDYYNDLELGYIELDSTTKQLKVKRGWTNNSYTFDVDGWSGRYGMPLEFLLSIHIATQMPDLAMDIATHYNTDVEVLLHQVNDGEVKAGFLIGDDTSSDASFITWNNINGLLNMNDGLAGAWNSFVDWVGESIDMAEAKVVKLEDIGYYVLFDHGLPHSDSCSCCSHIPGSKTKVSEENKEDCDDTGTLDVSEFDIGEHQICDECKNYVNDIITALKIIADKHWYSYTPYISAVRNHWFRDVYFSLGDINQTEVAITDEEYFYETNERWSLYETWKENDPDGSIPEGFEVGDYKLYTYNSNNNSYTLSKLSKKEVDERNAKIEQGDTSVSRLVKKLITKKVSDIKDAEGNQALSGIHGNTWIAYATQDTSVNWTKMEVTPDTEEVLKKFEGKLFYKEDRPNDIKQIEDGQRGATNPDIKKMFVDNKYYRYDGTIQKAELIEEDRKKHEEDKSFSKTASTADEELLGKVSITKDSLTAFSMLENTHTMDADYIYKDFKELIVELNYFDKEDLSDKIAEVMTWPLPETGSSGWPVRKYEKSTIFYGTLINSMVDMTLLKQADIEAAEAQLAELTNEDGSVASTTPVVPSGKAQTGSVKTLVEKGYEVHKVMEDDDGWDYCVYDNNRCDHRYNHSHGLKDTIDAAKGDRNFHNTCCATFVSWALKEAGFDLSNHENMHGAKSTYNWCKAEGWTPITSLQDMEPGDLLFCQNSSGGSDVDHIGHVQLLGNDGEWLNAGNVKDINSEPHTGNPNFIIGMRSGMTGTKEVFKGYKPNEPVVSPLTGKVTEYGEVKRLNVETGEDEIVEFIKIEAINQQLYDTANKGKGYLECKSADNNETFEKKASNTAKKLEGYDYFYDEYRGVLDGYVLYIEGFDLTLFDSNGAKALVESGDTESADVTRYEGNEVLNMVDDLEEARAWWKEDAKSFASPVVEVNGELYIKEGTVIGKTYEDPKDMSNIQIKTIVDAEGNEINSCAGNGNYIRMILRNLDDSIVEDVENYLPIEDTLVSNIEFEQLAYFLGCLEEGFKEEVGDYYGVEVLNDNAGNTTAFGLTKAVAEIVKTKGYPDFEAHLQAGKVPKQEAQDVFILVLEAAKESIENMANGTLDDNYLFALIDLNHASPDKCKKIILERYNKNGCLTVEDFEEYCGDNPNYADLIKRRGHNRGRLATEGRFFLYQVGSQGDEVIFKTETPWTEFCEGGGTKELCTQDSGFYTINPKVDTYNVPSIKNKDNNTLN